MLVFFFSKEGICQSPYYQGKTITFMQGRSPGGVGDLRNKVMKRTKNYSESRRRR